MIRDQLPRFRGPASNAASKTQGTKTHGQAAVCLDDNQNGISNPQMNQTDTRFDFFFRVGFDGTFFSSTPIGFRGTPGEADPTNAPHSAVATTKDEGPRWRSREDEEAAQVLNLFDRFCCGAPQTFATSNPRTDIHSFAHNDATRLDVSDPPGQRGAPGGRSRRPPEPGGGGRRG